MSLYLPLPDEGFFSTQAGRKKGEFLVALPLRTYPPLELSGSIFSDFFSRASKKVFFLSGPARPGPPLLVAGPLKKEHLKK